MDSIYILDKLGLDEDCKIEGAIFLTYSIDCKSILAALLKMFANNKTDATSDTKKEKNTRRELVGRFQQLLEYGMGNDKEGVEAYKELKEHVAFVCNDGYDKSIASPIYWYTKQLTYYYKTEYSFHPKLYIIKYTKKIDERKEIYFRIMVGSMNFVDSHNLDMMMVKDIRAYDASLTEERVQCTILNELLDYEYNLSCISNRGDGLKTVLDNLNLHGLWFAPQDIPEFLVFNGNNAPMHGKNITKVISPFLTLTNEYALNKNLEVYTMESELNKNGWYDVEEVDSSGVENEDENQREFYLYQADENQLQFNHTKLYVTNEKNSESIYIGSTNFSEAAFTKNKEILVKLEIPEDNLNAFKEEIFRNKENNKTGYVKKKFIKNAKEDKDEKEDDLPNLLKKISSVLSMKLKQKIEKNGEGFLSSIETCDLGESVTKVIKDIYSVLAGRDKSEIQIRMTPFLMRNSSINVGIISENGIQMEINPEPVIIKDRRLLDERYIFSYLYRDGKKVVDKEYVFSLQTNGLEKVNTEHDTSSRYMLTFLQTFLAEKKTNDSMLTKEFEGLMHGNTISLSNYCSKVAIPEIEKMLENWLDDDNYKPNGQKLEEIKKLISDNKLTETELKNFGITPAERRMVENLCNQWDMLKKELSCELSTKV